MDYLLKIEEVHAACPIAKKILNIIKMGKWWDPYMANTLLVKVLESINSW